MRKKIFYAFLSCAAALGIAACSSETDLGASLPKGEIRIKATASNVVSISGDTTLTRTTATQPDLSQFKLTMKRQTGTYLNTFTVGEMESTMEVPQGKYDVTLSYGNSEDEGFDLPYYYGKGETTVTEGETTELAVNATLANTMVSINYTDAFKKYFKDYETTIQSAGGKRITFAKTETRSAYVNPGTIAIDVQVTKANGLSSTFEVAAIEDAEAQTLYNVTIDVNNGETGEATLSVTFDSETVKEPITLNVSDEALAAPAPTVTAVNFTPGTPVSVFEGLAPATEPKVQIVALSGITGVTLTTSSDALEEAGFSKSYNLMDLTDAQQATLENTYGFRPAGLWKNPDKMALVNFASLLGNIPSSTKGENTSTFTLQVKDKYSKVSDPITLTVDLTPLELSFMSTGKQDIGTGKANVTVKYNGADFSKHVSFKAKATGGAEQALEVSNVKDNGDGTYTVTLNGLPNTTGSNTVYIYFNGKQQSWANIHVNSVAYTLACDEADVWSDNATVSISSDDKGLVASNAKFYIKTSNGSYAEATGITRSATDGTVKFGGLTPGTAYIVKAQLVDGESSNEVTFTTEKAAGVPNGNFETLEAVSDLTGRSVDQGGPWSGATQWKPKHNKETYNVSEPTEWATTNAKTACEQTAVKNTWFYAPSVYNVTDAQSGAAAMEIRNIGWDLTQTAPGNPLWQDGYNSRAGAPRNFAAGKLFLGTYSFTANTTDQTQSKEVYNQGVAFTSRPAKMTLYAKYTQDSHDTAEYGLAIVELVSADGTVIGSGKVNITPTSSWKLFTANITYSVKNKKAAKLRVFITSSNHYDNNSIANENNNIKTTSITQYVQKAIGAVLTVDNLAFDY